jgi:hypothetical protein
VLLTTSKAKAHPEEFDGRRERAKKCSCRHREVILTSIYIMEIDGLPSTPMM